MTPYSRRRLAVLVPVIGALLLAGCTGPQPSTTTALPTAPTLAASTPEASNASSTESVTPPEQVFGGECDAAFDPSVVRSAWGEGSRLIDGSHPYPKFKAVQQVGGLVCTWADSGSDARAHLVVIPVSAVSPEEVGETFCYGPCRFGVEASGLWLSGVVSDSTGDEAASRAIMDIVSDAFTSTAAAQPAAGSVQRGSWSAASDCEALSASAAIPSVLSEPSLAAFTGNGMAEVAEGLSEALTAAGVTDCVWEGDATQGFTMAALPGGAWMEDELRRSGSTTDVSITEAESAFFLTVDGYTSLEVFSDGNWMELQASFTVDGQSDENLSRVAAALVGAMPRA